MAKTNVTLNYFASGKRSDGTVCRLGPAPGEIPENRQAVSRLGCCGNEFITDWELFAKSIRDSALPDAMFFLDSSFVGRRDVPRTVWDSILSRELIITPLVWQEMHDWVENPFANKWLRDVLVAAKRDGHDSIVFLETDSWTTDIKASARYYVELLLARKLIGHAEAKEFRRKYGRDPDSEELTQILQRKVHDRGLLLAKKGLDDNSKPNFATDEQLVVAATFQAILSGREATILTFDGDLLEQFYKCISIIDTSYRSMLAADSIRETPENVLQFSIPHQGVFHLLFRTNGIEAMELPHGFLEWVLPTNYSFVNVHCWRFAHSTDRLKIAALNFCAEKEIAKLLDIKGRSVGTNTELLGGKNLHIMLAPPFPNGLGGKAIIGEDRLIPFGHSAFPMIDLNYVLMEVEHFKILDVTDADSHDVSARAVDLANFRLIERLMFTSPPQRFEFEAKEMATAIRFFNPSAIFFADLDFLTSHHAMPFEEALLEKGMATTTHIRDAIATDGEKSSRLRECVKNEGKRISIYDLNDESAYRYGYGHYLGLLAFRKLYWQVVKSQVQRDHGRSADDAEWPQIVEHYGGIRGRRVAESGCRRVEDPTLFYGDELLVQGMIAAVLHGADVVFFTGDPMFMEQFLKLGRMMREHYIACEIGCAIASDSSRFEFCEIAQAESRNDGGIIGDTVSWCELGRQWENDFLPQRPFILNMHCWLVDEFTDRSCKFMPFTFCGERPMHRMLRAKGSTGGLNVDCLGGRNLRIGYAGSHSPNMATIFEEEIVRLGSEQFPSDDRLDLRISGMPWFDLVTAINNNEHIKATWFE